MPGKFQIMRAVQRGLDSLETVETTDVLTKLCGIGRSFGYKVYASSEFVAEEERDDGEWLYDVTWLEYDSCGRGELVDAPLVVECEWGSGQNIENDFEKLLLTRAGVRVMIFEGKDEAGSRSIANLLTVKIREFNGSRAEDAWLLAAWEPNGDGWRFRYFTIGSGPSATEC